MSRRRPAAGSGRGRRPVRRRGMTLIEVLIALIILAVGATSLIALYAAASATHRRAVDRTRAALVADEVISEVQSRYLPGVDLDRLIDDLRAGLPERIEGYSWEVILHRPGAGGPAASSSARRAPDGGARAPRRDLPPARAPDGAPGGGYDGDSRWGESELVVRVAIRWHRASQALEEIYTTILLPRHPAAR